MDKMYDIKRHNSSCLAKRIVALCRDLSFGIITEQTFYDVIDEYIKKYPDLLFDGEKIKITVLNVIGKRKSNVIMKRRDRLSKEMWQQYEIKRYSSSYLGRNITMLHRKFLMGVLTEQDFISVLDEYIRKYNTLLFDGKEIKKTVADIIGKKKCAIIRKRREILFHDMGKSNYDPELNSFIP